MKRPRAVSLALGLVAIGLAPSVALASADAGKAPVPPLSGKWIVTSANGLSDMSGSLTVTRRHRDITGLTGVIDSEASAACGSGKVTVLGKQKIIDAKGNTASGHYSEWVVGRNDPKGDPVVKPIKVTVSHDGHRSAGSVEMEFLGPRGRSHHDFSAGSLFYSHGQCELDFQLKKS
jgi:hypothetical protein